MANKLTLIIKRYQNTPSLWLTIVFAGVCLLMIHLPLTGVPRGRDLTQHLQFASTYQQAILSGNLFPGWAASDNNGFGSVGIRFYPPVAYYLMAFTQLIIESWYDSFWINAFFWMLLGSMGMYLWAREFLTPFEAALAAMFYTFAPYHRLQIYHFVLFAEFAAMGILPFCLWTTTRLIRRGGLIEIALCGISFSLLLLTHIPVSIIGSSGLALYALFMMDWRNYLKVFSRLLLAGALGLLASSFHWLRLLTEMNWVKHNAESFTVNFYDYEKHLFPINETVQDLLPPMDSGLILLFLGLLPVSVYLFSRLEKKRDAFGRKTALALLLTGFISLFMTTFPSLFIWKNLSFVQKIQFPWRWLSLASLLVSLGFVFGCSKLRQIFKDTQNSLFYLPTMLFSLLFVYFYLQSTFTYIPLNREDFAKEISDLAKKEGCECWQPLWANSDMLKKSGKILYTSRNFKIIRWDSEFREFEIEPGAAEKIRVNTFYYPHWRAQINDNLVEIEKDSDGIIQIPLAAEKSLVKLNFQEPIMLQSAIAVSLLTWLFFLILLFLGCRKIQNPDIIK